MLVVVPVSLTRVWVPVLCGQASVVSGSCALTRLEATLVLSCLVAGFVVGFNPALVIA